MISACTRRRTSRGILAFLVALLATFIVYGDEADAPACQPPYGLTFRAKVVRVLDGDTIDVEVTRKVRIRLIDCWAPEVRTRDEQEKLRGYAAKTYLEDLIQNEQVRVHVPVEPGQRVGESFSFSRALGHVWLEGGGEQTIAETMISAGHATRTRDD